MTIKISKTLQSLLFVLTISFIYTSCVTDKCRQLYTYRFYKPIYLSYEDLRAAVSNMPPAELEGVGKIYYKAPYIFVNEVNKGIHVIDNSNPSVPLNIGFINIPGNLDIAIKGDVLFADSYIDLVAIDISNPVSAKEIWRDQEVFSGRNYNGWVGDPSLGVVTDWVESDTTIEQDCNSYNNWLLYEDGFAMASSFSGGGSSSTSAPGIGIAGSLSRFGISTDYLYCLAEQSIVLFNIQNEKTPINSGNVSSVWNAETLFPYLNYLFIGTTTGVSIYNNSIPNSPSLIATIPHVTGCDPVVVQGDYAYSTIHGGNICGQNANELNVIDIKNMSAPITSATYQMSNPYGLGIDGNLLFVCDDAAGLKMYDATNANQLELIQTVSAGNTRDVIPLGGKLILVSTNGIYQYDYSSGNLNQISFIGLKE
jgi:hypothetical protein